MDPLRRPSSIGRKDSGQMQVADGAWSGDAPAAVDGVPANVTAAALVGGGADIPAASLASGQGGLRPDFPAAGLGGHTAEALRAGDPTASLTGFRAATLADLAGAQNTLPATTVAGMAGGQSSFSAASLACLAGAQSGFPGASLAAAQSGFRASKLPRQATTAASDGTPLTDELLITIFDGVPDLADLIRFAATCRRWRRLVSGEAAFLCRTPRRMPSRSVSALAIGFFHYPKAAVCPLFVPRAAQSRHILSLHRQPSLLQSTLANHGLSFSSFRVVASRNGLVVGEVRRRGKHDGALQLCVCNPMNGVVHALPPLVGKADTGHYACTMVTADDFSVENTTDPRRSSSYFRLIMLHTGHGSICTTFHSYRSNRGGWSKEAKVTGAGLSKKQLRLMRNGIVCPGGWLVYWLAKNVAVMLVLATRRLIVLELPRSDNNQNFCMANTLLGFSPEVKGRFCLIQFDLMSLARAKSKRRVSICVYAWGWEDKDPIQVEHYLPDGVNARERWHKKETIQVDQYLPDDTAKVRLRWFCGRSGVIFFTAVAGDSDHRRSEVYTLCLSTRVVEKVASHAGDGDWGDLHGYEVDQPAYLASLAE